MQPEYRHTQKRNPFFYWGIPLIVFLMIAVPFIVIRFTAGKTDSIVIGALGGGFALAGLCSFPVLIWAGLFLSRLTVWIDSKFIRIRFGFGTWRKKFPLENIQSAACVRNDWFMGWGIHWIGDGWLYNIGGPDAVEITFENSKKARIGTDEPEKLAEAIREAIGKTKTEV